MFTIIEENTQYNSNRLDMLINLYSIAIVAIIILILYLLLK